MSSITKVALALTISLSMSSVASAAIIKTGTLDYDNVSDVIADSLSDKAYLGWDMVANLNYEQTVTATSEGGDWYGWRVASQTDAYEFYRAATGSGIVDVLGRQAENTTMELFSDGAVFGSSNDKHRDTAWFLSDEGEEAGLIQAVSRDDYTRIVDSAFSIDYTDTYSTGGTRSSKSIGWLLVRVPEPSIITLFGLGLVGLGFARRRRQS